MKKFKEKFIFKLDLKIYDHHDRDIGLYHSYFLEFKKYFDKNKKAEVRTFDFRFLKDLFPESDVCHQKVFRDFYLFMAWNFSTANLQAVDEDYLRANARIRLTDGIVSFAIYNMPSGEHFIDLLLEDILNSNYIYNKEDRGEGVEESSEFKYRRTSYLIYPVQTWFRTYEDEDLDYQGRYKED